MENTTLASSLPYLIAAIAGVFLLFGLWTPIIGAVIAIVELWIFVASPGNQPIAIVLAGLGATVAMIGPGVWSIDGQRFGRKHIEPSRHYKISNPPEV